MQGRFEKVAMVMPWMKLDTLLKIMPVVGTTPVDQGKLFTIFDKIALSIVNMQHSAETSGSSLQSQSQPEHPPQRCLHGRSEAFAQLRGTVMHGLDGVMLARGSNDAWRNSVVSDARPRQRSIIQWAVPQLGYLWKDIWEDAGLGVVPERFLGLMC
jgi:hypothetical protein